MILNIYTGVINGTPFFAAQNEECRSYTIKSSQIKGRVGRELECVFEALTRFKKGKSKECIIYVQTTVVLDMIHDPLLYDKSRHYITIEHIHRVIGTIIEKGKKIEIYKHNITELPKSLITQATKKTKNANRPKNTKEQNRKKRKL